jgi:hypothetical protein
MISSCPAVPIGETNMFVLNPACAEPASSQDSISELAERRLRTNSHPALKGVSCDYLDGVLVLRGYLPTYYLKQLAQEAIVGLAERIDNQIQVITPRLRPRPD